MVSCCSDIFDSDGTLVGCEVFLIIFAEQTLPLHTQKSTVFVLIRLVLLVDIIVLLRVLYLFQVEQFLEL